MKIKRQQWDAEQDTVSFCLFVCFLLSLKNLFKIILSDWRSAMRGAWLKVERSFPDTVECSEVFCHHALELNKVLYDVFSEVDCVKMSLSRLNHALCRKYTQHISLWLELCAAKKPRACPCCLCLRMWVTVTGCSEPGRTGGWICFSYIEVGVSH